MRVFAHLEELRQRMKWSILAVFFLFTFFAAFQIRTANLDGTTVPYPWPDPINPAAGQFFNLTVTFLAPPSVTRSVFTPQEAFAIQLQSALFLALVTGMPIIGYHAAKFVAPALYEPEKKAILRILVPSIILFIIGVLLAFFLLLPFTIRFLYSVAPSIGAQVQFWDLGEFFGFTLFFTLSFGATFELPIVMYALTATTVVPTKTWWKYWRFAVIGIFFFAALITPDTSGVTMLFVAFPMVGLYFGGYAAAAIHERRRASRTSSA